MSARRCSLTHVRSRGPGQSLAEFALVLPILLAVLMGLFDLGRAVVTYNTITNAAREGARLGVVNQDAALVEQRALNMAIAGGDNQQVTVEFRRAGPNQDPDANDLCTPVTIGCIVIVDFQADFTAITPVIGSVIGPLTMTARTMLPVEFACPNSTVVSSADCPKQP